MRQIIVIPARYKSGRLPGKPLIELWGVSLLRRTYLQCIKAFDARDVLVATDDGRIMDHCAHYGMNAVLTSVNCPTGTDRVAEVMRHVPADSYINVQGDEPLISPMDILAIAEAARENPDDVINGFAEITSEEQFRSLSIPKVIVRLDGRLLYMSRAAIPTTKTGTFEKAWRQICVYAFPPAALHAYAASPAKTSVEHIEDIEILRFLELGFEVRMLPLSNDSVAVDTPGDIARAEEAIKVRGLVDVALR